ncbi:MAG: iron-dependent repressor [Sphingobacteriales bacterium 17-39-43]|uniref:metal-dependent transcriptional regulator n=1 Tax=Daejeonella sp. TaxID=2805397 RepID=UPI000BD12C7C|nr:metal-dependent transcriptional regulator [Daejeonella sp.]OYX99141.1 MAG: iron-dependent repressor [Sphingobacteriia bacterium 35-40-5]OYZ29502.1 MAG: iron-dependent repressor [Sphingobacteriales bacterium 16-39-50]OZA22631.1 MAG: iron-dependent repressor [Sphingobacteriales bacterium 17-39-43]HQT24431.1 metal-dependent transcriptional regulator [Daejeonella sp.]HQT58734.1 metal-dependent transcriptional regulator [Daejeonella sp.]
MHSFTEENYLKAIYHLSEGNTMAVSTNQIAEMTSTKAASVTDMLKKLAEKKLINYIKYQGVTLTGTGVNAAVNIIRKHRLWEVFLVEKLGFKWDEVHDIAEELEHINSETLINRLDDFLGNPVADPHGDPIPDRSGLIKHKKLVKISDMQTGESGTVSGVSEHSSVFLKLLEKLGLTLGTKIIISELIEFDGSIMLTIDQKTERTISREVAKNILVIL